MHYGFLCQKEAALLNGLGNGILAGIKVTAFSSRLVLSARVCFRHMDKSRSNMLIDSGKLKMSILVLYIGE